MIYILDENTSERFARMLDAFERNPEHSVRHITDYFSPGTKDPEWINDLAERKESFTILSKDNKILRNEHDKEALRKSGLTTVILEKGWTKSMPYENQAWVLVKAWPKIVQETTMVRKPTLYRLNVNGKLLLIKNIVDL